MDINPVIAVFVPPVDRQPEYAGTKIDLFTQFYDNIPHGVFRDTVFHSNILNNSRQIRVYLPARYTPEKEYPVILFHDGLDYINLASAWNVLDYLIAHQMITSVSGSTTG